MGTTTDFLQYSNRLNDSSVGDEVAALLEQLAEEPPPGAAARSSFTAGVELFNALGLAEPARQILRQWRLAGASDGAQESAAMIAEVRNAEMFLHISADPDAAAAYSGGGEFAAPLAIAERAALETVRCLFRGEARRAVDSAEAAGWFLAEPKLAYGLFHGVWALFLLDEYDRAAELIAKWQRRHESAEAWSRALVRRFEAALCGARFRFVDEAGHLAAVLEIERDAGLAVQAAYTEAALAGARARAGESVAALALIQTWDEPTASQVASAGPLAAYRDRARTEVALTRDDFSSAYAAASRAAAYFYSTGHFVMASHLRFLRALAAPPKAMMESIDDLRSVVKRTCLPRCTQRLALLEELAGSGASSLSQQSLREVSTRATHEFPLYRAFTPTLTMLGADIFWNRACGKIHVRGNGPFELDRRPTLARALEVLTTEPGQRLTTAAFFSAVWKAEYNALLHEGKVHVTVHRLRRWLGECSDGAEKLIDVSDGTVGFHRRADIRVLHSVATTAPSPTTLETRILTALGQADEPMAPRTLEQKLGASRSTVQRSLRRLLAAKRVQRKGLARASQYVAL